MKTHAMQLLAMVCATASGVRPIFPECESVLASRRRPVAMHRQVQHPILSSARSQAIVQVQERKESAKVCMQILALQRFCDLLDLTLCALEVVATMVSEKKG